MLIQSYAAVIFMSFIFDDMKHRDSYLLLGASPLVVRRIQNDLRASSAYRFTLGNIGVLRCLIILFVRMHDDRH